MQTLNVIVLALNSVGVVAAFASLSPLRKVAALARTPQLRQAWMWASVIIYVCIASLVVLAVSSIFSVLNTRDLYATIIHVLGPVFVNIVAYLSLRTATDLLRIDYLEVAAHTDPLTGALNRAGLLAALRSTDTSIGVIVADLDHFKTVNDRYGHDCGDHVLQRFVDTVRGYLPTTAHITRFGGEEFVIVVPNVEMTAAVDLGDRLRSAIKEASIMWRDAPVPITVSVGVAKASCVLDITSAIADADKALYRAKRQGRDQVCAAHGEEV